MGKSSFEDHMKIVEGSHTKTASASKVTPSLLDKLAAEMQASETPEKKVVDAPAKTAVPAETTVAEAAAAVVAATDAIAVPQTNIAGGNQAEKEKGMQPAASKPSELIISDGDKTVMVAQGLNKEPAAVAEAAEKTASLKEADEIGRTMARSFHNESVKIASGNQFVEAYEILKTAGLLENYKPIEGLEKKASEEKSALEKIANVEPLTKNDMIKAASEYIELEKQAAEADAYGREEAHKYFAGLVKQAEEEEEEEKKEKKEEKKEAKEEKKEEEKMASDSAVTKAIDMLVKAGVIKA
jgi:hypothetical protein